MSKGNIEDDFLAGDLLLDEIDDIVNHQQSDADSDDSIEGDDSLPYDIDDEASSSIQASDNAGLDEEGNECAKFGLKTGVSGTNWRIEENLNWGKKHSEGGIDLTMTDDGIVFRRNNSDIKAPHG